MLKEGEIKVTAEEDRYMLGNADVMYTVFLSYLIYHVLYTGAFITTEIWELFLLASNVWFLQLAVRRLDDNERLHTSNPLLLLFSSLHGMYIKPPILRTCNYNSILFSSALKFASY